MRSYFYYYLISTLLLFTNVLHAFLHHKISPPLVQATRRLFQTASFDTPPRHTGTGTGAGTGTIINTDSAATGPYRSKHGREADSINLSFSHIQLYVDDLDDVEEYMSLQDSLSSFPSDDDDASSYRNISTRTGEEPFVPYNRDLVKQLICGFDFRVTGYVNHGGTRSVLVTSADPNGVQLLITTRDSSAENENNHKSDNEQERSSIYYPHFDESKVSNFYTNHNGRQGIGVLGFFVSSTEELDQILSRYRSLHPRLLISDDVVDCGDGVRMLEVYAYYLDSSSSSSSSLGLEADDGTVLRFMSLVEDLEDSQICIPGVKYIQATFSAKAQAAYCDHWVSNVISRTGFIDTLADTLGFTCKVDFNAGVVAAGEAQIESTVAGNSSPFETSKPAEALKDQSQVYLPINNALSEVGHVHGFLEEIGQGIQHVASRVDNLIMFVQNANERRELRGEGFTFLNIPRSYYGVLTLDQLMLNKGISYPCAAAIMKVCEESNIVDEYSSVNLSASAEEIESKVLKSLPSPYLEEFLAYKEAVVSTIMRSRYLNLYNLLRDRLSEETYMGIVRNKILVDLQGEELLFQIFTGNILQREPGDESPFFEFIQRVCSTRSNNDDDIKVIRSGCGGFGIRNFLTLFLSIEVSKAMRAARLAQDNGDEKERALAEEMVQIFTEQLNESNPILTTISDAMTKEGEAKEKMAIALAEGLLSDAKIWEDKMKKAAAKKVAGNESLMECSKKYMNKMKYLRER